MVILFLPSTFAYAEKCPYPNATGHIAECSGFECEGFSSHHRVGEREFQEEGPEGCKRDGGERPSPAVPDKQSAPAFHSVRRQGPSLPTHFHPIHWGGKGGESQ